MENHRKTTFIIEATLLFASFLFMGSDSTSAFGSFLFIIALVGMFVTLVSKKKDNKLSSTNTIYNNDQVTPQGSLFDRNVDIIRKFRERVTRNQYRYHAIENLTRDCVNEICQVENKRHLAPNSSYLSSWRTSAPVEWKELSNRIEKVFNNLNEPLTEEERIVYEKRKVEEEARFKEQRILDDIKRRAELEESIVARRNKELYDPELVKKIHEKNAEAPLYIESVTEILKPSTPSWLDKEKELINTRIIDVSPYPMFVAERTPQFVNLLNQQIESFNNKQIEIHAKAIHVKEYFKKIYKGYQNNIKTNVEQRLNYIINDITLPPCIPKIWKVEFDPEESIAVVELKLPDVVHNPIYKFVKLVSGHTMKPLSKTEVRELVPGVQPAILLRVAYEIFSNDILNKIKLLVLNGWVEFDDPKTGNMVNTYTASFAVQREQIINLKLDRLKPEAAFTNLKGKSAGNILEIIPVEPILSLNKKDKRFVDAKEVLNKLGSETNLASMDWQDFEHLIRELFEKEFAKPGLEVKITQASRDRGVDAIIFDPDPIKGGKFVIQAKRYANTVDVSSVRDLCAVVKKEGASRGILVTTSTYGADAYAFANNEPVTLLNGAELLGLLKKHGYTFRISLEEAKKLNLSNR